jgi:hypothetical protein
VAALRPGRPSALCEHRHDAATNVSTHTAEIGHHRRRAVSAADERVRPPNVLGERPAVVTRLLERKHGALFAAACGDEPGPRTVLELGPGEGFVARAARDRGLGYVGVDTNEAVVAHLRGEGHEAVLATVPRMPPGIEPVDLVYASHVIEHLPGTEAVEALLQGCHELVAPGGAVALVFPDLRSMGVKFWDVDTTHEWPSTPRRVSQAAERAGWTVERVEHFVLHAKGPAAVLGRAAYRLYPTRLLGAVDPRRAEFWYRGSLLLTPDVLVRLVARA